MDKLWEAFNRGQSVEITINGRKIICEPNAPISGMTLFNENGFVLGKEAFSSQTEFRKTLLHELQRLHTSNASGGHATNRIIKYLNADVPVDCYLADQLVLPSFMAGKGSFIKEKLSLHTETVLEVASLFTEIKYKVSQIDKKAWLVEIGS